jgi:hypothetical protein
MIFPSTGVFSPINMVRPNKKMGIKFLKIIKNNLGTIAFTWSTIVDHLLTCAFCYIIWFILYFVYKFSLCHGLVFINSFFEKLKIIFYNFQKLYSHFFIGPHDIDET